MIRRSMKKVNVPADYNDAGEVDSAQTPLSQPGGNDAPSTSTPASPEVSASYRRKRQREEINTGRDSTYQAARNHLTDARNRMSIPTREEDDDKISGPIAQSPPRLRQKRAVKGLVLCGTM